ncbi:hypothetical protein HCR08_03140 [Wolbachia pipientis]|nr:hypothetical protein [Wolbachia pipientis]
MLLLYHSHKHISYPIRTIARSAILLSLHLLAHFLFFQVNYSHLNLHSCLPHLLFQKTFPFLLP